MPDGSCNDPVHRKERAEEVSSTRRSQFAWKKKGLIFDPGGRFWWMNSYAQNPNVLVLEDRLRVYFTCRPERGGEGSFVSYIGYVELDRSDFKKILYVHDHPVLDLGGAGDFDEFGTMPGSVVEVADRNQIWLYYVGWTRMQSVPYKWANGLAISEDGGVTFEKFGRGPIMASTYREPYLQACPRVWRRAAEEWLMWYQSGLEWNLRDGHADSVYVTMAATSQDGIHWQRDGAQVIPSKVPAECQTSASVIELEDRYHMFFSYRHGIDFRNEERGYRIGYASSSDLQEWHRDDEAAGLHPSVGGWDSEMVCYPHVVTVDEKVYMFYCGNAFGREGFGYAELVEMPG